VDVSLPDLAGLFERAARVERAALERGILEPIATRVHVRPRDGVRWQVRVAPPLGRRASTAPRRADPFDPPDPDLLIGEAGPAHLAVLNRFPVLSRHVLLVTRTPVPQEALLDEADWAVLLAALREGDALGFYNGGTGAGASQGHKHLQVVPLPLAPGEPAFPLVDLVGAIASERPVRPPWPFPAAAARLPDADPEAARDLYLDLLGAVGLLAGRSPGVVRPAPYNLLVARGRAWVVPRRAEGLAGISVNSLGFAGSLLVRDEAGLARVDEAGPAAILAAVAGLPGGGGAPGKGPRSKPTRRAASS
jgi:ATP adenylyltransferase